MNDIAAPQAPAQEDSPFVRFWNEVLAPKFIRFKHVLVDGLSRHSDFDALLSRVEFTQFEPRGFFTNDSNTVVDLIDVKFIVRATGKEVIEPDSVHIWHFNDQGKVQRFKHRVDTWQSAMALRADQ